MANLRGKWTVPGYPLPSSHLISAVLGASFFTRCGRQFGYPSDYHAERLTTDEPQSNVRVCERCSVLSRRDG